MVEAVTHIRLSDLISDLAECSGVGSPNAPALPTQKALLVAEAEWRAAIAALTGLLPTLPRSTTPSPGAGIPTAQGVTVSGPLPVLNGADFDHRLESWVVTPQPLANALQGQRTLLPASGGASPPSRPAMQILPLALNSPILSERFCLVMTPTFSMALVLGQPTGKKPCLQYSFDPTVLMAIWQQIRHHVTDSMEASLARLDHNLAQTISVPDYQIITRFTQAFLSNLPHRQSAAFSAAEERGNLRFSTWSPTFATDSAHPAHAGQLLEALEKPAAETIGEETELLQAMAHEIRTPLTTIRTLTRSLLRRKDVTADVKKRLHRIDIECTQQIDRFNLIFRAVELETAERDRPRSSLTPIALSQIFTDAIPRWQQQAQRRNLKLDVTLPPALPRVTSDPTLLNEVLTGVVEWFTQCLPPQSHIHMTVMLAGHQLKLQFEAEPLTGKQVMAANCGQRRAPLKAVGQLLSVAPETGGVSLNLDATKNLFEFLGGKLILRQRPEQGDVLTAFLPLDTREV